VCEDPRQYVPVSGQAWTTLEALRDSHRNVIRAEGAFTAVGVEPSFAIGQRALLVDDVLWDCVPLLDADVGPLRAVAISHPHYYSTMVEWADAYDCPVLIHEADREWVMRPSGRIEFWSGSTLELGSSRLIRCGGHFAGGTVLLHESSLLAGDIVQVIPDRAWVSFMYSFPNYIPLPADSVQAIASALAPYSFERIYGAWWGTVIEADGAAIVQRSAQRYVDALNGKLP
jgi:glyoxylase-like metal-dependent hydrolase (beta-lactamase superfamily II)